ncbi:hypothetical protein [Anatilimnocola floriformis]|uniref:hypothetical protein n=1 Tax=Anatilimnocola floriformis TaxID=2948575 RepID=UPI0020C3828E|nr:hypothetical protein [Anatilimnocola floriformis]
MMDDRRMLNVASRLLADVVWRLVQSTDYVPVVADVPNSFSLRAQNDVWSHEDESGGPELTIAQRSTLWQAIRLTQLAIPHNAELALLRLFLRW